MSSAIADRMIPALGGPGYRRLLVAMPEKVAVFADGEAIRAYPPRGAESWRRWPAGCAERISVSVSQNADDLSVSVPSNPSTWAFPQGPRGPDRPSLIMVG